MAWNNFLMNSVYVFWRGALNLANRLDIRLMHFANFACNVMQSIQLATHYLSSTFFFFRLHVFMLQISCCQFCVANFGCNFMQSIQLVMHYLRWYIPNEPEGIINLAHFKLTVKTAKKFSIVNKMCRRNIHVRYQSYATRNNRSSAHCQVTPEI